MQTLFVGAVMNFLTQVQHNLFLYHFLRYLDECMHDLRIRNLRNEDETSNVLCVL